MAKNGNTVVGDLIIGKTLGAGTMVRVPGKDDVWQAIGSIKYSFDKSAADWRDKSITTFAVADVEKDRRQEQERRNHLAGQGQGQGKKQGRRQGSFRRR